MPCHAMSAAPPRRSSTDSEGEARAREAEAEEETRRAAWFKTTEERAAQAEEAEARRVPHRPCSAPVGVHGTVALA